MGRNVFLHSLLLLLATILTFFWVTDENLSYYSLQLTGILLISLIFAHRFLSLASFKLVESVVATMAVLLVTSTTGGVTSPLFFLNLLLLFELSLLLEPVIPIILSAALLLFYFYSHQLDKPPFILAALFSFPLMTPLAYFTGKIYQKSENQKKEIRNLTRKVEELKEELVEEEIK